MNHATIRGAQGIFLGAGAPLGWLLIQRWRGMPPAVELAANPGMYLYMLIGTMAIFGVFGLALGNREERLLRTNRQLEELAVTDPLTGLRNARYFYARLEEEEAERKRTGEPLAVAIIDLDHFKRINDEHGHLVGDDVLASAARAIAAVTRKGDTGARVGGEEFALMLPGSTAAVAADATERVRQAIGAAETRIPGSDGTTVRVTASAGVASTADFPSANTRQLYNAADDALYRAKAEGRDRTVVASAVA